MNKQVIIYEDYIDEVNDHNEQMLAKKLGPQVTNMMGERVRVTTGDVVDDVEYTLMGGFANDVKKAKQVELPVKVDNDMRNFLGKAYNLFATKNDMRSAIVRLLRKKSWPALYSELQAMRRQDGMRPYYALTTLCASAAEDIVTASASGKMSEEEARELGLL